MYCIYLLQENSIYPKIIVGKDNKQITKMKRKYIVYAQ